MLYGIHGNRHCRGDTNTSELLIRRLVLHARFELMLSNSHVNVMLDIKDTGHSQSTQRSLPDSKYTFSCTDTNIYRRITCICVSEYVCAYLGELDFHVYASILQSASQFSKRKQRSKILSLLPFN